jgi:Leucine-rich repeat (LRR) protein
MASNSEAQMEMEDYFSEGDSEDLSYSDLDAFPEFLVERAPELKSLQLDHNHITVLPRSIGSFFNLVTLDISNNQMTYLSKEIAQLHKLRTLTARNNNFDNESLPKELEEMTSLQVVNFSGNQLTDFPMQFTELTQLKCLYLGGNNLTELPSEIVNLKRLEVLYLGGNNLKIIPEEVGYLLKLTSLILCDNKIVSLPRSMSNLRKLQSLSLHNNHLATLPPGIVTLDLVELSLRNNPLVVKFVEDMVYRPPSLLELAGRCIKIKNLKYTPEDLPQNLISYLGSAHSCVNPKCKGVYFTSCVEHVKFVDFCGKYRLPLLQYLCSPSCSVSPVIYTSSESDSDDEMPVATKMKKVLLG